MSSDAYIKIGDFILRGWQADAFAALLFCLIFSAGIALGYLLWGWQ